MSHQFDMYKQYYNSFTDPEAIQKVRNAARLMVAIVFGKPIIVVGEDFDGVEKTAPTDTDGHTLLLQRYQERTKVCELDHAYLIPEEVRQWRKHPNYLNFDLRASIEESHLVHIQCFLRAFHQFFKSSENSRMDKDVVLGQLVVVDPAGLRNAAREWLAAFRESEYYNAAEAEKNIQRDTTTYIGFVENGVLDEHERTHTLKSAHLYFQRMFRWLPLAEADDGYTLWAQTKEEDVALSDEMSSDWPQVWPCTLVDNPDDLLDRCFPIVQTDVNLGAFGNDATGGYCIYLPRYVIAQYTFDC